MTVFKEDYEGDMNKTMNKGKKKPSILYSLNKFTFDRVCQKGYMNLRPSLRVLILLLVILTTLLGLFHVPK